jgi:uncharacterized protein (DUF1800 family)
MSTSKTTRTTSGIAAFSGSWDTSAILHLLKRVHFGVTKEDLDYFKNLTMAQAVSEILTINYTPPSPPINNYNDTAPDSMVPAGSTWINDYNGLLNGQRLGSYKMWWAGQIINQDRTIREKMVVFWHNHFATQTEVVSWANLAYKHNALLRNDCLKNFRALTKDVTLDPAMLIYLNGEKNTKAAPDENYSRELQELFTLGKGPNSQYTEQDVIAGARVLTGWRIDKTVGTTYFQENRHDTADKQFSSFYNNTVITGKSGASGATEVDDLLDMIFTKNEVSMYLVRKLYRFFVYYDIDETTETNVIAPLAAIFKANNYEIKPVLEALFQSEHFFDVANRGAIIKSPADFTYGVCRTFDIQLLDNSQYVDLYRQWFLLAYSCGLMQQDLGDPPSVSGWPAYYQIPQYHELWINSDTLPNRNKVTDVLAVSGHGSGNYRIKIDAAHFTKKFSSASDPTSLIDDVLALFHTLPVEQAQKDYMKTILLAGQINDSYWTTAWNDYKANPNDNTKYNVVNTRLSLLYKYMMNLSEFQLS